MSWLFSRALVAEYLAENASAGELSVPLSVMPTPHKFYRNDKPMEHSNLSQFGLTCAVLTESRGEELLRSFRAASRVRTYQPLGREQGSTENAPGSGRSSHGSFARYVPDLRLWKIPQGSLLGDFIEFSGTWPKWGSMRNGVVSRLKTPSGLAELRRWITSVRGSGSSQKMPTPGAAKANNDVTLTCSGDGRTKPNKLGWAVAVARAPTPRAADGKHAGVSVTETTSRRVAAGQANLSEFTLETLRVQTPTTGNKVRSVEFAAGRAPSLLEFTRVPTPHGFSKDGKSNGPSGNELGRAVNRMPTPTVQDSANNGGPSQIERNTPPLNAVIGGSLNPDWVEWLMGWPIGWTDLKPLEMDRFQQWPRSHGDY